MSSIKTKLIFRGEANFMRKKLKVIFSIITTIGLVSTLIFSNAALANSTTTAPSVSFTDTYNFFTDKYSNLTDKDNIFQTAEFGEIYHYLLGGTQNGGSDFTSSTRGYTLNVKQGNHIFLLGGTWSPELQASIGYINNVAKEYGITAIYNFDPHLDGANNSVIDILADPGTAPVNPVGSPAAVALAKPTGAPTSPTKITQAKTETNATYAARADVIQYKIDLAKYNTDLATYNALTDVIAYNNAVTSYNTALATYNARADVIKYKGDLAIYTQKTYFRQRGDALSQQLLGDASKTASDLKVPSIIIWNKDNAGNPIVSSLNLTYSAADLQNSAKVAELKTQLRATFDKISQTINGKKKANNVFVSPSDYYLENENARYNLNYGTSTTKLINIDGSPITVDGVQQLGKDFKLFTDADKSVPFEVVTYQELRGILASKGNYAVLFAGLWCPNSQSTLRNVYEYAVKYNIGKVYVFDFELDSTTNNSVTSLRNSNNTLLAPLYIDLFNNVLTNIGPNGLSSIFDQAYDNFIASENARRQAASLPLLTDAEKLQYRLQNGKGDGYSIYEKIPGKDTAADEYAPIPNAKWASRVQLNTLLFYNKDHKDASANSAPVISKFEQLWYSGGNLTPPGSFGYFGSTQGRVIEYGEFNLGDGPHNVGLYDTTNNASIPIISKSFANIPEAFPAGGADYRGLNTPIVSRSYWNGLDETLNAYVTYVLQSKIDDAAKLNASDYTKASYDALQAAIADAKATLSTVDDNTKQSKTWVTNALNAPLSQARLTAQQLIPTYQSYNTEFNTAYASVENAVQSLSANTTASNPKTGDNIYVLAFWVFVAILTIATSMTIIVRRRRASVK
jgi:hypothetical protein